MSCRLFGAMCVAVALSGVSTPAAERAVAGAAVSETLPSRERTGSTVFFPLPGSVASLRAAIQGLLRDPDRLDQLRDKPPAVMRMHDHLDALDEIYCELVS